MKTIDLVIAGAAKAGTTSLEQMLIASGGKRIGRRKCIFGDERETDEVSAVRQQLEQMDDCDFAFHVRADYLAQADAIKAIANSTTAHVVMVCRDPSERLWSHFWHEYKKGRKYTARGFECWLASPNGERAIVLSKYGNALKLLLKHLNELRLTVLFTEDLNDREKMEMVFKKWGLRWCQARGIIKKNQGRMPRNPTVNRCLNQIIQPLPKGRLKNLVISFRNQFLTTAKNKPPMLPKEVRRALIDRFFAEDIQLFEKLSGHDTCWDVSD